MTEPGQSTSTIEVYKCPTCGGAVRYDAAAGALACRWCGNAYDATELEPKQVSSQLSGYLCPECGAELMADDFIAADTCPYCGNNEVAPHRFEGEFKPDFIIPFSITKQEAIDCYENTLARKAYLPDDFIEENRIISVQGTYVPFWLQDGKLDFEYMFYTIFRAGLNVGNRAYHFRAGTYEFSRVPVDGSTRMPDDLMDSIEPYNLDTRIPFSTEYLPGFIAERYTESLGEVAERFDKRIEESAASEAMGSIALRTEEKDDPVEFVRDLSHSTMQRGESAQILLPVWTIVVMYQDKKYLVGVNGQTGKVAVNLPIDEKKQREAALKPTVKTVLISIPLALLVNILWIIILFAVISNTGVDGMIASFAGLFSGSLVAGRPALIFIDCILAMVLFTYTFRDKVFSRTKESVRQTMQNVEEATDSSHYSTINITERADDWGKGLKYLESRKYRQPEDALSSTDATG